MTVNHHVYKNSAIYIKIYTIFTFLFVFAEISNSQFKITYLLSEMKRNFKIGDNVPNKQQKTPECFNFTSCLAFILEGPWRAFLNPICTPNVLTMACSGRDKSHDLIKFSLEAASRRNCTSFNLVVHHLCWQSKNSHMICDDVFPWRSYKRWLGFVFLPWLKLIEYIIRITVWLES